MKSSIDKPEDVTRQLRDAYSTFLQVLREREKLRELGEAANRKGVKIQASIGEGVDRAEAGRRISELFEEKEITRIHDAGRVALGRMFTLQRKLLVSLDPLRSPHTRDLFHALDSLNSGRPYDPSTSTERYINLADSIISSSDTKRDGRRGRRNTELTKVKNRIRDSWAKAGKTTHRDFCNSLELQHVPMPPSVQWNKHGWIQAYSRPKGAVTRWLSRVLKSA